MANEGKLNCLIVGCGNIAGVFDVGRAPDLPPQTHAGAYSRHGGFRIAACVDPDPMARSAFMRRWQVSAGYSSLVEVGGETGEFDVISICSPTVNHLHDVQWATQMRPRVIFCEKPLAPNTRDGAELVRTCRSAEIALIVNYNRRWDESVIEFRQQLARGDWGAVRSVQGVYTRGILNNGSHMIDLLHLLFGKLSILNVGHQVYDGHAGDPSVAVMLEAGSGIPVALACGDARDYSLFEMQIVTERGVISMEDGGFYWRVRKVIESSDFKGYRCLDGTIERIPGRLPNAMLAAVAEIYEAANGKTDFTSTGENALAALEVCEDVKTFATQRGRG